MSGESNYYAPVVNMNGGRKNIAFNYGGTTQDTELRTAIVDLTGLLRDLRPHLAPDQDRTVEDALPELVPDRDVLNQRGIVLESLRQIAVTVGEVGRPAAEAVSRLLALLG
ncbi:hypothetical protein SHKM778_65430 [Streptomyces sp. KM77-8]|uniref:Uncharacterized protein n=1 Tax=Streptomyces haneummycinicus TaxID=3074435 RepID=A0AAT9HSC0_9ACTN